MYISQTPSILDVTNTIVYMKITQYAHGIKNSFCEVLVMFNCSLFVVRSLPQVSTGIINRVVQHGHMFAHDLYWLHVMFGSLADWSFHVAHDTSAGDSFWIIVHKPEHPCCVWSTLAVINVLEVLVTEAGNLSEVSVEHAMFLIHISQTWVSVFIDMTVHAQMWMDTYLLPTRLVDMLY